MDRASGVSGAVGEGQYIVERILRKRIVNRKPQYFIRWKGFGREDDSWVPKGDIWPGLVTEFERKLRKRAGKINNAKKGSTIMMKKKRARNSTNMGGHAGAVPKKMKGVKASGDTGKKLNGFARGHQPEKILGVGMTQLTGKIMFLMKWKNNPLTEFVPHQEVKDKCPQVLIAFYEERICWNPQSTVRVRVQPQG